MASVVTAAATQPTLVLERRCRACDAALATTVVDLGETPLANSYLSAEQLDRPEPRYPLRAYICEGCFLMQLDAVVPPADIFSDYAYFSSVSESWVAHAKRFADQAIERLGLDADSHVVEIASNDGYLLQHFVAKGIPVLGIEPAANVAETARERGIETRVDFFSEALARNLADDGLTADLVVANNVLAHVPEIIDFVRGIQCLLKPGGVATLEFPHLLCLLRDVQFDTIYHEHLSYLSLGAVKRVLEREGLALFDVEPLPTHGGSLRVYACRREAARELETDRPAAILREEEAAGLHRIETYQGFAERVDWVIAGLIGQLEIAAAEGRTVVGYGAAAKGNTLLNVAGINSRLLPYVVDRSEHKQGLYLPGSHIPIRHPDIVRETRPDNLLILPWNLRDEIMEQMSFIRDWGGRFILPIRDQTDLK